MVKSILVLGLCSVVFAGTVPLDFAQDKANRIVSGEDAQVAEIPYQVSLQYTSSSGHFCGGSILNRKWVITAAHCVNRLVDYPSIVKVIAGTIDLSQPQSTHYVNKIILHEDYDEADSWKNDIALLEVIEEFVVSDTIQYVTLPNAAQDLNSGDTAIVSGWGRLSLQGESPLILQRVDIEIASQEDCMESYKLFSLLIYNSQVCADVPEGGKGSCNGDSGGPLTVNDELTGLVSWAYGCASKGFPTVYTRVSQYLDWISTNAV